MGKSRELLSGLGSHFFSALFFADNERTVDGLNCIYVLTESWIRAIFGFIVHCYCLGIESKIQSEVYVSSCLSFTQSQNRIFQGFSFNFD